MENIEGLYFDWMCSIVGNKGYFRLLQYLDLREFYYILPRDGNRAADGIDLRYRFGREKGIDDRIIATELDIRPCSILEMMVALAIRMEDTIMGDDELGNRTNVWFWSMISSLGLSDMIDQNFDISRANDILYMFLERLYAPDGHGGLFTVKNPRDDMRRMEIWYQMHSYIGEIL